MTPKATRWWGMVMMTGAVGLGCTAAPLVAPRPVAAAGDAAPIPAGKGGAAETAVGRALLSADRFFITQYRHARFNPKAAPGDNANCGPTSLAMAVTAFGRVPAGANGSVQASELIRTVRTAMTGECKEGEWTYPYQVRDGARKLGLHGEIVLGYRAIVEAMRQPGRAIVLNLNPSPAYADQLAIPYDGGHFALLTRIDGDRATVCDPLADGPIEISLAQLKKALTTPLGRDPNGRFIAAYEGGVVVWP